MSFFFLWLTVVFWCSTTWFYSPIFPKFLFILAPPLPLWDSSSELSESLAPGLKSSVCLSNKRQFSNFRVCIFSVGTNSFNVSILPCIPCMVVYIYLFVIFDIYQVWFMNMIFNLSTLTLKTSNRRPHSILLVTGYCFSGLNRVYLQSHLLYASSYSISQPVNESNQMTWGPNRTSAPCV